MAEIWRHIAPDGSGFLASISDAIHKVQRNWPECLIELGTDSLVIASDYSGQHSNATHEAFSFFVTSEANLRNWLPKLQDFRSRHLPDKRRLSFKTLREPVRAKALPKFFETVGTLSGNLFTFMVDRRIRSISSFTPSQLREFFGEGFEESASDITVEKSFRVASLLSLVLASLKKANQKCYWVSDHDEILDSWSRREAFSHLMTYLTFALTKERGLEVTTFATTRMESAPFWSDDLVSITDFAAGACCRSHEVLPTRFPSTSLEYKSSFNRIADSRSRKIIEFLSSEKNEFRHMLVRIELDQPDNIITTAQLWKRAHEK